MAWTGDALSHSLGLRLGHWRNMIRWNQDRLFPRIVTATQSANAYGPLRDTPLGADDARYSADRVGFTRHHEIG